MDIKREGEDGIWEWDFTDDAGQVFHFPFCNEDGYGFPTLHKPSEVLVAKRIIASYE